jgi:phosphonate transport system substrate-binding protein
MFRSRNPGMSDLAVSRYALVASCVARRKQRRDVLRSGAALVASVAAPGVFAAATPSERAGAPIRFGTTPVFLDDQAGFLARWSSYLTTATGGAVQFVQRRSYRDIMGLLRASELDAAWICGYPWVVNRAELRGLSIPTYEGGPWYRSYLIVPAADRHSASLADMAGKVYAFSDPDSNSGYLVPRTTLIRAGLNPDSHFSRTFFTWGHRNVVSAVADGLAEGGSVDGYVWGTLKLIAPELVGKTRVAWRSALYGFPPLVVRATLDRDTETRLRIALLGMTGSIAGSTLLKELNLTAFGPFREDVFKGIAENAALVGAHLT